MEQANFNFDNILSGISNIFKEINEKAVLAKEKHDERLQILKNDTKALEKLLGSLSEQGGKEVSSDMQKVEEELSYLDQEYKKLTSSGESLRQQVDLAKQTVEKLGEERKQKSLTAHPRARFSVNVYRDMSKVNWHEEHEPNKLKGFVRSKAGLRTFCFDREKQSSFFIANSLWEMGEDELAEQRTKAGSKN
ncbi:hypothetical protein EGW08_006102 [Elysia chlorotica]|uniref:Kinetochore protein Spc24 n=1 Tax=Elysia chlorotica TaxID=188477 RepID=A0A433TX27_ELYCH|nr:hypothetical protein EGW08_006102 [Elysia chlorotica]